MTTILRLYAEEEQYCAHCRQTFVTSICMEEVRHIYYAPRKTHVSIRGINWRSAR